MQQKRKGISQGAENIDVEEFYFLGCQITAGCKGHQTKNSTRKTNQKKLPCSKYVSLDSRKNIMNTYLWTTALYGCESWLVRTAEKKKNLQILKHSVTEIC